MRPDRVVRQHLRTKFLITTKAGMTWEAILMDADSTSLMLFDAVAIGPEGSRTKADGQVFLPRGDVAYMQKS